ncbi:hypothetical protein [Cellulomonas chengniuliangii]|uniref:Uncharacterized protein n=1 Tax=Cellulomonas chengniuliangii TaxID=2968084 RepID=A0ABY5L0A3_9CELL|nr:hypothetical protein [Cellulomonas chengniuliangii]MCC2309510.1 hypothetical protein [Cellulomonas chengniuliangii]MCC2316781.1 hypothetical protein [Cellulomonas chengniuliangii]UUI74932.1 hypothetical protein NP064_14280 [Cellulomonas chengniuliangii]
MPTTDATARPARSRAIAMAAVGSTAALLAGVALALDRWAPGNMGRGFAIGALIGAALACVALGRAWRRPERATTGDRLFAGAADERDEAVATRAFAVLGAAALPMTFAAAIAIALGAPADATVFFLIVGQVAAGWVAFASTARRF